MKSVKISVNGRDASVMGIWFEDGSLTALMTPAPKKEYISNVSVLEHGKRVLPRVPKNDSREVSLDFALKAVNLADFIMKYTAWCRELDKGLMDVTVRVSENETYLTVTYYLLYLSCRQYTEFNGRLAKFSLRMIEPNPGDRFVEHSDDIVI